MWFTLNWLINIFFIIDLLMNFIMAYQNSPSKGGLWVTQKSKIVRNYLFGWFPIDLITVIDFQARFDSRSFPSPPRRPRPRRAASRFRHPPRPPPSRPLPQTRA